MRKPSGFPDEVLLTWTPEQLVRRSHRVGPNAVFPTDLGYFPRARGHFRSRPRGCPQVIVLLCLEGRGVVRMSGQVVNVGADDVVVIPAGVAHEYWSDPNDPWTLQWVHVTGPLPWTLLGRRRLPQLAVARAREHFWDLLSVASRESLEVETTLALGWWLTLVLSVPPLAMPPGTPTPGPIAETVRWMTERLAEPLTVADLASVSKLSPSRFRAVFVREVGAPPMVHLTWLRVQKARTLLERSTLRIAEVARLVGYDDALHFSRVFHRATGVSPREWKRNPRG